MNQNKVLLFCSVGFVVQMYILLMEYFQFNTVVNVDYESSKYQSLPALTICSPKLLSIKRVVEYFQRDNSSSEQSERVTKAYELYQSALVNYSSIDNNNNMTRDEFVNFIYKDNFESLIPNLTIKQLYQMSIPIRNYFDVEGFEMVPDGSSSHIVRVDHSPIESIMLAVVEHAKKCFTYFSHLDDRYRNKHFDIMYMRLILKHDQSDFPISLYHDNKLQLTYAIHSGNTIPSNHDQFDSFEQNRKYIIEFNRFKIQLLKSPYKTNCLDYDQSGKKSFIPCLKPDLHLRAEFGPSCAVKYPFAVNRTLL